MSQRRQLSDAEKRDWLRLTRTENVGPVTFRLLLSRFGSARAALDALPEMAKRGGGKRPLSPPSPALIEDEIAKLKKLGGQFVFSCEDTYPEALAAIEDAPPVFALRGRLELLHKRCIGVVGARNASLNGRKMSERLARDLGQNGIIVASGMARGIDTSAHQASLNSGTIAVLAGGVDIPYPEENKTLYDQLCEQGAVISDQHLGCEPRAQLFPRRNRLISGLSLGVIVVEAALRSGSLITARMALEQGREVFAVPGSPLDPRANGTNDLIRQGAVLVETIDDVLQHIHALPKGLSEPPSAPYEAGMTAITDSDLAAAQEKILMNLSPSPTVVDELVRQCQLSPALVLTVLLELELAGRVERQPGGRVALIM